MKPSQQLRLYGLNKYLLNIVKLYDNKMMPNKILFSGKKGSGKSTLAYHIINYLVSLFKSLAIARLFQFQESKTFTYNNFRFFKFAL